MQTEIKSGNKHSTLRLKFVHSFRSARNRVFAKNPVSECVQKGDEFALILTDFVDPQNYMEKGKKDKKGK